MVDAHVVLVVRIELINDIDGLGSHAELRHERIVGDDLFLLQAGLGNQVVELDSQKNLSLVFEVGGELLSDGVEVLVLVQRIAKKLPQFGINGVRIVVAQEAQARVDLLLKELALHAREGRKDFDESGEQIRTLSDRARLPHQPADHSPTGGARPGG